jgi:hypothetical protein
MKRNPGTLIALFAVLLLAGCGTEPTTPAPTPKPTPPPKPKVTSKCQPDGEDCKLTVADIKAEQGTAGHTCDNFDAASAVHYSLTKGPYKGIKVVKSMDTDPDFVIAISACGDAPADPFANMPSKKKVKEWKSGHKNPKYKDAQLEGKHYTMMVTEEGAKKGKDPHIVIDW